MRKKFFNSKESQEIQAEKARRRRYANYWTKRALILESLKPEIERVSTISKLAEYLASQVTGGNSK